MSSPSNGASTPQHGPSTTGTGESCAETSACSYTDYDESEDVPAGFPKTGEKATGTEAEVWDALYEVEDPEMPVSIVDLGLIYGVHVDGEAVNVDMTLTYTGCPAKDMLTNDVRCAALTATGIREADITIKYSPPWSVDMVTDRGREQLREFGLSV